MEEMKKTVREGTPVHQKEIGRARTRGLWKKISKEGALVHPQTNSQGVDLRTWEAPVKRCRVQKKRKEKKWKRKKNQKKREVKYRRSNWWTKRKEQISSFFVSERKRSRCKGKRQEEEQKVPGRNKLWESLEDGSSFS